MGIEWRYFVVSVALCVPFDVVFSGGVADGILWVCC